MRARLALIAAALGALVLAGLWLLRRPAGAPGVAMSETAHEATHGEPASTPGSGKAGSMPPPRFSAGAPPKLRSEHQPFSETAKVIELHEAQVKKLRDTFIASANLDEAGAAKYDAIVRTINTRFEAEVLPRARQRWLSQMR